MRKFGVCGTVLVLAVLAVLSWSAQRLLAERRAAEEERRAAAAADSKGPMIVHDVYFTLKDNSPQAREKLVAACKKYLTKHPGEVFFAAGTLAEELKRDLNDRDFDVGLHIVFQDMKAHNTYQDAARHKQFIDENKDNWKKVRVFDTAANP